MNKTKRKDKIKKQMDKELTLLALRGISASGRTTFAKELEKSGWVRVERDEIRLDTRLFPNGYRYPKDESRVVQERDRLIREALDKGLNVVSSDTNLNPIVLRQLKTIAEEFNAKFEIDDHFLDVPLATLIERDKNRENSVGEQVIRKQFHQWVKTMPTFLGWDESLETIVCVDLDSSLTNGPKDRSPYDWQKVGNDEINLGVAAILDGITVIGMYKIFILSGRDEVCRPETIQWLERNDVEYDALLMRRSDHKDEKGNQVKDTAVKAELIEKNIRGKYNVLFYIDDRPAVCRLLRDFYGINVLQRGDVHHEF